jgi:hypothetical protein
LSGQCEAKRVIEVSTYTPFKKQQEFHRSPAKYRLFGGAAGPGKSAALTWEAIIQANEFHGVDTLLLRRTFPELEESLLREFHRNVPRDMYKSFNEAKHIATWWNGSTTRFGYCQGEQDVYQYQGAEYAFIGIDELTMFTLRQWQFLTSRNRCPVKGVFPNMAGATNPGNIGHVWVKALWGCDGPKRPAPGMERPDQYDPNDYEFIRARLSDNPIYANDTSYRKTLEALPTHLRDAFLYGSWDIFAGQYFDIFDRKKHVTRVTDLKSWYPRWISIDWGFAHNFAVYWHTTLPDGQFATYREFVDSGLEPDVLVAKIAGLSKGEHISDIYISPDTDARRDSPDTIYKQMGKQFESLGLPHCRKADDDRKGGWLLLHQLLKNECLVIDESCVNLIDKIPTAVRDPNDIEDIEKCDGDDEIDAWRYGYKSRLEPAQAPLEVRMEGNLASLETETDQYGRPISRTAIMNRLAVLRKREEEATTGMPWTLKIN